MKKPANTTVAANVNPATVESALASVNAAAAAKETATLLPTKANKAAAAKAAKVEADDRAAEKADMDAKAARLQQLTSSAPAPHLIAIRDNNHIAAIEDRRHTPAIEVVVQTIAPVQTKAEKRSAAATKRINADVAKQIAAGAVDHGPSNKLISDMLKREAAASEAPAIPTTGYQGPMRALRDRVKAGAYQKAANGQPSCGDEVATILGQLEPVEVIAACLTAMDITNPYGHLNIGQQSMNLRNKLRGQLKRGEIGMGVLREAVEVTMEARPPKAPMTAAQMNAEEAKMDKQIAKASETIDMEPAKAKRAPKPAK